MVGSKRERLKEIIKKRALIVRNKTEIVLASGLKTNFFFDMKAVLLYPESANLITDAILKKLLEEKIQFDYLGGMESGSVPIISLVCANSTAILGRNIEGFYMRKKEKDHGARKSKIEGNLKSGARVVIVDDVTTTGSSIIEVVNEVEKAGCKVVKVMSIVDRCQGAKEFILAKQELELDALFTAEEFGLLNKD
ncbi:MAG: orotate phosphoribosyltransferase [Methanophagales archaeon]|nr:orotate phosphoribosyltransferase [Methanophagales archaeon]